MIDLKTVLNSIPANLKTALIQEYNSILTNFLEHRWQPSELSGGRFCEIVYNLLDGHAKGSYPTTLTKPSNFVDACKRLEANGHVPRSFQILIPRLLPALYEIRNNRNVGHIGGDVDSNLMDATAVVQLANWIMGELIRVFHSLSTNEAQVIVNAITEKKIPFIWEHQDVRRILLTNLSLAEQILLLAGTTFEEVTFEKLLNWLDYDNPTYLRKILTKLHKQRQIEFKNSIIYILPPGNKIIESIINKNSP